MIYQKFENGQDNEFRKALAETYLVGVENERVEDATFTLAWEYGHSYGYSEVESFYMDLAQLALEVISATNA